MLRALRGLAEGVAAAMMAAMFLTFLLQILIRYTARLQWVAEAVPALDPAHYGWTLEFCLALWVWLIFWGAGFVVREEDHVSFDILRDRAGPRLRTAFVVLGAVALAAALWLSVAPTWDRFHVLRLKKTATLSAILGDGVRMRDVYAIYILFLVVVPLRYLWGAWRAMRAPRAPQTSQTR